MKVSIIIAVKEWNEFLRECITRCLHVSYPDFEIIVLPDTEFSYDHKQVRVLTTGPCLPADKRDQGARAASGEILAFIDDDAYPAESWLTNAVKNFNDAEVAAVGGPGVTPPTDRGEKLASGLVYQSFLVSGNFRYRYQKGLRQVVDDYPSCNLLIRKSVFLELGGFKTNFWPGEDTILCLEITKKLKKKIVYEPEAVVFHHRRAIFSGHLRQIANYAMHRGYFVKRFPETSLKWQYFIPSAFLCWLVFGFFLLGVRWMSLIYVFSLIAYFSFVLLESYQKNDRKMTVTVFAGIFLTHIYYGYYFLFGLAQPRLQEEFKKGHS